MRSTLIAIMITVMPLAGASAQTAAVPATSGVLNGDSPIEAIVADPVGNAILEKEMPKLLAHPGFEQFKSLSLRQLQPYSSGAITDEAIAKVEAALKAAAPLPASRQQ